MQARLSIIDLLLIGLDKPAPSLSHFLLGFDLKKHPSGSTLHAPGGVLGAVRTPLHAVLGILRPEAGGGNPAAALTSRPKLCEAAYRYVYFFSTSSEDVSRVFINIIFILFKALSLIEEFEGLLNIGQPQFQADLCPRCEPADIRAHSALLEVRPSTRSFGVLEKSESSETSVDQVDGGLSGYSAVAPAAAGGAPRGPDVGQVGVVAPQDARHRTEGRQRRQDEVAGQKQKQFATNTSLGQAISRSCIKGEFRERDCRTGKNLVLLVFVAMALNGKGMILQMLHTVHYIKACLSKILTFP